MTFWLMIDCRNHDGLIIQIIWHITYITPLSQWYGGTHGSGWLAPETSISGHYLHLDCRSVTGIRNGTDHKSPRHVICFLSLLLHSPGIQKLNVSQVFCWSKRYSRQYNEYNFHIHSTLGCSQLCYTSHYFFFSENYFESETEDM